MVPAGRPRSGGRRIVREGDDVVARVGRRGASRDPTGAKSRLREVDRVQVPTPLGIGVPDALTLALAGSAAATLRVDGVLPTIEAGNGHAAH